MNCPECGTDFDGQVCECGWTATIKPPERNAEDMLTQIISAHGNARRRWPVEMPTAPRDAAVWFRGIMSQNAKPDLLVFCLRRFLQARPEMQRLVILACQQNIYWRGEDIHLFSRIINEHERMQEIGTTAYREESRAKARTALRGMGSGS